MSAPTGQGAKGKGGSNRKTADELMAALFTDQEYASVLKYSRDNGLEEDSAVYFLVAMLKLFAFAYDRILTTISDAEEGCDHIAVMADGADRTMNAALKGHVTAIQSAIGSATGEVAIHAGTLYAAIGEIRAVKEELQKVSTEAAGTYRAYERLANDGSGTTLSQLFQKAALEALDRRVPFYDDTIRTLILNAIAKETRKLTLFMAAQALLFTGLLLLFRT